MNEDANLGTLTTELRTLEIETFEVVDYAETNEVLLASSTTSSTTSTCSCSA
jgi:thiazolylpeptide-type bacteriocin precursor